MPPSQFSVLRFPHPRLPLRTTTPSREGNHRHLNLPLPPVASVVASVVAEEVEVVVMAVVTTVTTTNATRMRKRKKT